MPRFRCSSIRASLTFGVAAVADDPTRCANPAVISPYSALPTSNSTSPESSITCLTSRVPSSSGTRAFCVADSVTSACST